MIYRYLIFLLKLIWQQLFFKNRLDHSFHNFINNTGFKNTDFKIIKDYRKQLKTNKTHIIDTDQGKGSRFLNSKNRTIQKMASIAGTNHRKGLLLAAIVNYYQPEEIIELGTSLGLGTFYLNVKGNIPITTIEGNSMLQQTADRFFKTNNYLNITSVCNTFENALSETLKNSKKKTLVFIDGNHTFKATLEYVNHCLNQLPKNSIFIVDDIHWSREMHGAWNHLKRKKEVRRCINMYYFGIIELGNNRLHDLLIHF